MLATANVSAPNADRDWAALAANIARWGSELGFQQIGIAGTDLSTDEARLIDWLAAGRHGTMDYMARHGATRARPAAGSPPERSSPMAPSC